MDVEGVGGVPPRGHQDHGRSEPYKSIKLLKQSTRRQQTSRTNKRGANMRRATYLMKELRGWDGNVGWDGMLGSPLGRGCCS